MLHRGVSIGRIMSFIMSFLCHLLCLLHVMAWGALLACHLIAIILLDFCAWCAHRTASGPIVLSVRVFAFKVAEVLSGRDLSGDVVSFGHGGAASGPQGRILWLLFLFGDWAIIWQSTWRQHMIITIIFPFICLDIYLVIAPSFWIAFTIWGEFTNFDPPREANRLIQVKRRWWICRPLIIILILFIRIASLPHMMNPQPRRLRLLLSRPPAHLAPSSILVIFRLSSVRSLILIRISHFTPWVASRSDSWLTRCVLFPDRETVALLSRCLFANLSVVPSEQRGRLRTADALREDGERRLDAWGEFLQVNFSVTVDVKPT